MKILSSDSITFSNEKKNRQEINKKLFIAFINRSQYAFIDRAVRQLQLALTYALSLTGCDTHLYTSFFSDKFHQHVYVQLLFM